MFGIFNNEKIVQCFLILLQKASLLTSEAFDGNWQKPKPNHLKAFLCCTCKDPSALSVVSRAARRLVRFEAKNPAISALSVDGSLQDDRLEMRWKQKGPSTVYLNTCNPLLLLATTNVRLPPAPLIMAKSRASRMAQKPLCRLLTQVKFPFPSPARNTPLPAS